MRVFSLNELCIPSHERDKYYVYMYICIYVNATRSTSITSVFIIHWRSTRQAKTSHHLNLLLKKMMARFLIQLRFLRTSSCLWRLLGVLHSSFRGVAKRYVNGRAFWIGTACYEYTFVYIWIIKYLFIVLLLFLFAFLQSIISIARVYLFI